MRHDISAAEAENALHDGPIRDRVGDHDVIDCRACGFCHIRPLPTPEEMAALYRAAYYAEVKPTYLAAAAADRDWARLAERDRLRACAALLGPGRRRLIDIGCGPGFFLSTARAEGWEAIGFEPARQAAAHARALGATVIEDFLSAESAARAAPADVVHLHNVLEHVPEPARLLRLCRDLLTPGGLICVIVPNDYNGFQEALRQAEGFAPWWVAPPHHVNYFDFDSLARLLARTGFAVLERATSFPMELFLLMGENYVGDAALGRACHLRRKRFDLVLERAGTGIREAFYRALAAAGLGREAVLIARRNGEAER